MNLHLVRFSCHGRSAPAYSCSHPGDMSGEYIQAADAEAVIENLAAERDALAAFAREAFKACFRGCDWDGATIQEKGFELGLLDKAKFDPDEHHETNAALHCEPGDTIYFLSETVRHES